MKVVVLAALILGACATTEPKPVAGKCDAATVQDLVGKPLAQHEAEAKRRDHRALGKQLNLFSIQQTAGGGLVFWHPKGATMRNLIEDYWKRAHVAGGYELLNTPHMASIDRTHTPS